MGVLLVLHLEVEGGGDQPEGGAGGDQGQTGAGALGGWEIRIYFTRTNYLLPIKLVIF